MHISFKGRSPSPLQTGFLAVALLTLLSAVLRTVAVCAFLDANIGYFESGAPAVILSFAALALAVLFAAALPFLIKKENAPAALPAPTLGVMTGAAITALLSLANAIYLFTARGESESPTLYLVAAIVLFAAAAYFLLQFRAPTEATVLSGYGAILAAALLLSVTYFDRYTQMNAPHKISLHVTMLSFMLYLLFELRFLLFRAMPRVFLAALAACFTLSATFGISNVAGFLCGSYDNTAYLMQDLLSLGFAVYTGARAASLAIHSTEVSE